MGPLLLSLVLQTLTQKFKEACPALALNVWFLDDGTFIGQAGDVLRAVQINSEDGPLVGLQINPPKYKSWWPTFLSFPSSRWW